VPLLFLLLAQVATAQVPAPHGFVNDFAGVIDSGAAARMEALLAEVRARTRGEITVVTMSDLGGRPAADIALRIGRAWGVGAKGEAGDPAKNLGVVVLLEPLHHHQPGTGQVFIATGRGAEGFLNDARVGRIRDAMTPYFAREDYSDGLETGVKLLAQAFADEFHVDIAAPATAPPAPPPGDHLPLPVPVLVLLVVLAISIVLRVVASGARGGRRRRHWGGWWYGGWGGGGFGGWGGGGGSGGGFGGGFGGFGGGGGFSGGGAGGRF
jgi:uncharacterized protein